jgi:glycosyltransferase involved in cell wall biosynthesis
MRLAIIASHPIQYHAPIYRELAKRRDLMVFFAHSATGADQARAGFGVGFDWDSDLFSGYAHTFLRNVAIRPGVDRFFACDTPEISSSLRDGRFDAVLLHGWHLKTYLQAIVAAKRLGQSLLVRGDSHLATPRSRLKKIGKAASYPMLLRLFNAALYVGERSRLYWTHYRYPETRLFFSPHCIDTGWFAARATGAARSELRAQLGISAETTVALFAGKLVPIKRPLDVITAAARMKAEGRHIEIIIAGAGPLEVEMVTVARASGVSIHPLGFCNQSRMPQVYAAADVLILPSAQETWGLVANEALACGRPIILSDAVGAAPDLAGDMTTGRVFPVGNIAKLAEALHEILTSPPTPEVIAAKSSAYSSVAAADGIEAALSMTTTTGGRSMRWPKFVEPNRKSRSPRYNGLNLD